MQAEDRLKTYRRLVDGRIAELIPPETRLPAELHAAMRYSCLAPGKRFRPALCLSCARSVGGDRAATGPVLDAACAVEMVHAFSLIHDDLPAIDDDDLRRGRPTCHIKFGEAIALLAGDALFSLAFESLSAVPADAERVVRCLRSLAKAAGSDGLVGGEVVDVLSEGKEVDEQTVGFIHSRKTGALISAACEIGAIMSGGDEDQVRTLKQFGSEIGLSFQIADDLLNESSSAELLGKAAGSDRARAKATYPSVLGEANSKSAARSAVDRASLLVEGMPNAEELRCFARFVLDREH